MKKIITAFAAILLFISCQDHAESVDILADDTKMQSEENTLSENRSNDFAPVASNKNEVGPPQTDRTKKVQQQIPDEKPDWDKKIIKTANLNLEIKDFKKYNSSLREKVKRVGGYVAQEEQSESAYKIENRVTIKVPVDQFDEAVNLIVDNTEKLNEKKINSQDVTSEFVDVRSRLESKKQVRLRYLDLLKQAKNMQDILSVQSEINGIQEEIESASGRIEFLSHSSLFSTIHLTFYQILNEAKADSEKPSFGTKLSQAFGNGWSWIGEVFVGLVSIWPLMLMVFVGFIIYKKIRREKPKTIQG